MKKCFIGGIFLTVLFLNLLPFLNWNVSQAIAIENPIIHGTFTELIKKIIEFLRNLALVVTPLVIILAGYYFVASGGDPAKITKAKQMILYALIGLLIILSSEAIIALIEKVIKGK